MWQYFLLPNLYVFIYAHLMRGGGRTKMIELLYSLTSNKYIRNPIIYM